MVKRNMARLVPLTKKALAAPRVVMTPAVAAAGIPVMADCVLEIRCAFSNRRCCRPSSDTCCCSPASTRGHVEAALGDVDEVGAQQGVERDVVAHHADHRRDVIVERREHRLVAIGPRHRHIAYGVVVEGGVLGRDERGLTGSVAPSCWPAGGHRRYAGDAVVHARCLVCVECWPRLPPRRQRSEPAGAHARAKGRRDAHRALRVPILFGAAIPFFICTSTGVSWEFQVAENIRNQEGGK